MNLEDCQDEEIYECLESAKQRFDSKIEKICAKYSKPNKSSIIDIRDFSVMEDEDDGSPLFCEDKKEYGRDQKKIQYFSESDDEDYVDSSYNDGRCSSSLASSNCEGKGSPPTLKIDETCPGSYSSHFNSKKMQTNDLAKVGGRKKKGNGSFVKIENTDVFVDIFRSAELQKNEFLSEWLENESEPFEDDFVSTKWTDYGKPYKRNTGENTVKNRVSIQNGDLRGKGLSTAISRETDFKTSFRNSKLSPIVSSSNNLQHKNDKEPITKPVSFSSSAAARNRDLKHFRRSKLSSNKNCHENDDDIYDVSLLEEPELKGRAYTVDRSWSKNKLRKPCSSTDSLNALMDEEYRSNPFNF